MSKLLRISALVMALLAGTAFAAPALTDAIPLNPHLKLGKLDNGLTYYIEHNAKPAKRVELRLVVNAGSILEDEDQRGMAHLLEHMGFNGTAHFKKHELIAYLQSIGVRFGADLNASTGFDATIYMLPIPTDKPGNLEQGMTVLGDWAQGMLLNDKDIEDERNIVLEEQRQRRGYGMRSLEAILPKLANGSRYKDRLPIGTEESIAHATPDAVRRFYRDWYRPDLMAVVVVGDIDPLDAERMIKARFGTMKAPVKARARPTYPMPALSAPDAHAYVDKEAPNESVQLIYSTYERKPFTTVGGFRDKLVRRLFGQLMGVRFSRLTQVAEPPFVGGGSGESPLPFGVNQYAFMARATIGKAGVGAAIDTLVQENERARQFGFSDYDLDVAKRSMLASYEYEAKSRATRDSAAVLGEFMRHFLAGDLIPGIEQENEYVKVLLPTITLDEINAYAKTAIPASAPKLVLYTGNGNGAPDAATLGRSQLLARVDAAFKLPVTKNQEKALPTALMSYKPEPGRILSQSEDKELGLTTLTLSNGVKVILKPTNFSKDAVQMLAVRTGGQMLFPEADKVAIRHAGAVERIMGVASYSPSDLQRMLAGRNVSLNAGMSHYGDSVTGASRTQDIESMLQLNYLAMTSPRRDENLFRSYVSRNASLVRNLAANPDARFAEARSLALYGGHPRVELPPKPEDFESLNLDRTLNLHRSRLGSAKGMTFLFAGDFDVELIKPLLASYVATLPVRDIALEYRDPGIRQVPGVVRKEVKAGIEKKSTVTFDFSGDVPYSTEESMAFGMLIDVLKIRITDELREKRRLIYSGSVSGRYDKIPRSSYAIAFSLPTAPESVEKVEEALWGEIVKLQAEGPSAEDLNKVKQAWKQDYQRNLRENGYWLNYLRLSVLEGKDMREIVIRDARIDAVKADDVKAAAKRFLDRKQYVEMVLKPEA